LTDNGLSGTNGPQSDVADGDARAPHIREGSGQFTGDTTTGDTPRNRSRGKVEQNGGVTLNLAGASVPEVAKTIFGDILKANYTVSDKAKASITLSTAHPVHKEDLLTILASVLRTEGIVIEEENGVYHIVPADGAAGAAPRWASKRGRSKVGTSVTAVPLRYVSAEEMERVLKAVAPQTSILHVDSARNLLLVSGSPNELESIKATVETFDVDWMRGMSFALLPVESADPETMARELDTVFANDTDSPGKGIIRFVPNNRLKSVLVISSRPEYLRRAANWLQRIDLAGQATEKRVHVYHVQNRPAVELAALLRRVYSSQQSNRAVTVATQPEETTTVLSSSAGGADGEGAQGLPDSLVIAQGGIPRGQGGDGGLPPVVEASTGEQATEAGAGDEQTTGISIVADDPNNALIITATPQEYKRMSRILSRIDIAASQVLLEATIAEVTLTDDLKFGLKWFFEKGNSSATFTTNNLGDIVSGFPGFSYFLNTPNVQLALDALNSVTTVNLVSSPSLMVLDNKKAILQIGDEVPIATQQATSVLTPGAPVVNSISFRSTGVILGITPRVGDNGRVQLDIEQEVSDVKVTDTSNLDSPTISQRRVKTSVAVGDGESIVLAGLMRDRNEIQHNKVPLMGDIPVVGNLFKSKDDNITRTELFIAITPHVVKDPQQIRSIADEFRDRMNFSTRPQRGGPPDPLENVDRLIVR
jgi:general secretion pathway protein D